MEPEPQDEEIGEHKIRPLPKPPRCRGVPFGGGRYSGCVFGFGDRRAFTGILDCPVCLGSGYEDKENAPVQLISTRIPHSRFGGKDCHAFLSGYVRVEIAKIVCNDCDGVLKTVPAGELQRTLDEMEMSLEFCMRSCPYCKSVNFFPGFSQIAAYDCDECGEHVEG